MDRIKRVNEILRKGFEETLNDETAPQQLREEAREILQENARFCGELDLHSPEAEKRYFSKVKPDPDAPERIKEIWRAAHPNEDL